MPGTNIASMYESLIFRVSVDGGVAHLQYSDARFPSNLLR